MKCRKEEIVEVPTEYFQEVLAVNLLPVKDVTNVNCKLLRLLPGRKVLPKREMRVSIRAVLWWK